MMRRLLIIAVLWAVLGAMPRAFAAPLHDAWRHPRIQAAKATLPHIALLVHRNRSAPAVAARKPMLFVAARPSALSFFGDGDAILPAGVLWVPPFVTGPITRETLPAPVPHRFSFVAYSSSPRDPPALSAL